MLFSIIDTTTTDCRKLKVWYFPCLQLSDFLFFPPPMIRYQVSLIKMDGFVLFSRYIGCFYFILIWGEGVGKLSWNFLLSLMGVTYYCSVYFCDFPSINDRLPFLQLVMLFFRKKFSFFSACHHLFPFYPLFMLLVLTLIYSRWVFTCSNWRLFLSILLGQMCEL